MDIREQIGIYLNTSFKQNRKGTIYAGHNLVNFGYWTRMDGFVKKNSSSKGSVAIPCPVICIVDEKIREQNLILTITGKIAEENGTEDFQQLGTTITKKIYKTGTSIVTTTLTIERFTRPTAIFLLSGLGNKVFEITNIEANIQVNGQASGGKITFYGLASEGSKILYYLGMFNLHNSIKNIINSIWIAPTKCPTCSGTGLVEGTGCHQCSGYGYSGENASRGIALDKGFDVGISRKSFDSYPLSESDWNIVWKFINKAWTQKWWVTPTKSQIRRMFAHFYNVGEDAIRITERFHFSMPQWNIRLPIEGRLGSPFVFGDISLMKFIARSVTPAGVNVFVGFYDIFSFGNLDELQETLFAFVGDSHPIKKKIWESSFGQYHGLWKQRFRFWNGWCECVDNFEGDLSKWNISGVVDIYNVNDIGRHWCRLYDDSAIKTITGLNITNPTGVVELWIHPNTTELRIGSYLTGVEQWGFYVDFRDSGFYDNFNHLIRPAKFNSDYHLKIEFVSDAYTKYYYGSPDNFNNEVVGTSWDDIGWVVQSVNNGGVGEIISEWQGHKNCIRLSMYNGNLLATIINITKDNTIEFYIGCNDFTNNNLQFVAFDSNKPAYPFFLRFKYSKVYILEAGTYNEVELQTVSDNTWYHCKITWRADNTYDVWIDGVKKVDNLPLTMDMGDGVDAVFLQANINSGDDSIYFDAYGDISDPNYNEGDNLINNLGYTNVYINKDLKSKNFSFRNPMAPGRPIRVRSSGVGYGFIDNFGGDWISGYEINDNYQRLYPWGWGKNHRDCLSGVYNLYEKYFRNDKVFVKGTGVCV